MSGLLVRIGIPASFRHFVMAARELEAPVLVSANAFWRHRRFNFRPGMLGSADVALDSAGFVAMSRYWGYPWRLGDYVALAARMRPTWWAAPDYCCEPEIASDRAEVMERVTRTAFKFDWACQVAAGRGVPPPLPVLQGWLPDDYLRCAGMMPDLPALVGVGSMCRRDLGGPVGVLRVVSRLDRELPRHVRLHLFGVKGSAIGALAGHPRIHSVDSMAWDYASRRDKPEGQSCDLAYRTGHMRRWYRAQRDALGLFG